MQPGDISMFTSRTGQKRPAIVTVAHEDGTVDLAVLSTTHFGVHRSPAEDAPDTFFDPTMPVALSNPGDVQDEGSDPAAEKQGESDQDAPGLKSV